MSKPRNQHRLNGKIMTGAEMVIQILADEGVPVVFGYSGGAILPTYDAIFKYNADHDEKKIQLIVPANEQGAGFMAAGFSRASGSIGVAMVTSGPGATNMVTPVRDCMADSIPIVVICGQVATKAIGTDAFQEAAIFNIMSSCAKHVLLITDPNKLESSVRTAFEIARTGRPGPVVIDLPKDVQNWVGPFDGNKQLEIRGYRSRLSKITNNRLSESDKNNFLEILGAAERPLIYAGGGVINANASQELLAFAERFNIPVVTTLMGIGSIPTTHRLNLRMLGMHGAAFANYAVMDCDFLICLGARFDDRVAGIPEKFAPNAKIIAHFDIDPAEIGKVKKVDWSYLGSLKDALNDLVAAGAGFDKTFNSWVAHTDSMKAKFAMGYDKKNPLIQPYAVIETLSKLTSGKAIITTGVGQHQMWAAQYSEFMDARTWLTSGSMGTMGFGLPAAIGAQIARPERIVVDIDGDGSLRMNLGELETATTYGLPVKVLLLNNLGDGMVRQWQTLFFDKRFSGTDKSLHQKDFVKAAEADGFKFAKSISNPEDVESTLKEFVEYKGPAFLEVFIDRSAGVYPMVGPGKSLDEMLTGPYINARIKNAGMDHNYYSAPPDSF